MWCKTATCCTSCSTPDLRGGSGQGRPPRPPRGAAPWHTRRPDIPLDFTPDIPSDQRWGVMGVGVGNIAARVGALAAAQRPSGDVCGFDSSGPNPDACCFTPHPILLDLDGNGIRITEQSRAGVFVDAGGDGLLHRTAWAGAGDGVLFYDPDDTSAITEKRQYVFTEWGERRKRNGPGDRFRQRTRRAPTAADDLAALRSVFDSNGDGDDYQRAARAKAKSRF